MAFRRKRSNLSSGGRNDLPDAAHSLTETRLKASGSAWAGDPLYLWVAMGQCVFYVLAFAGTLRELHPKILRLPYYFCMINAAMFAALCHVVQGRRKMAWK